MTGEHCDNYFINRVKEKIKEFDDLIERIAIFGGEPLDQSPIELEKLLRELKSLNKEIWLFTSYELDNVPDNIKELCDYIKTGIYDESLKSETESYGYILASSNQKIHKLK